VPADRAWCGRPRAFDDQIHRRPRHLDRRDRRRRWQFRLGEARRPLSAPEPAGSELSQCAMDTGGQAVGSDRLCPQDAGHVVARHRCADEPVQRVPVHPAARDLAIAHARSLRQRDGRHQAPGRASQSDPRHPPEPNDRRACRFRAEGRTRGRAPLYRRAQDILPRRISAMHAAWRSIRRRRPIRSSRQRNSCRPGSTKITSACRSESNTKRTLSPTCFRRSRLLDRRLLLANAGAAVFPAAHDFAA